VGALALPHSVEDVVLDVVVWVSVEHLENLKPISSPKVVMRATAMMIAKS